MTVLRTPGLRSTAVSWIDGSAIIMADVSLSPGPRRVPGRLTLKRFNAERRGVKIHRLADLQIGLKLVVQSRGKSHVGRLRHRGPQHGALWLTEAKASPIRRPASPSVSLRSFDRPETSQDPGTMPMPTYQREAGIAA
ncbi:hypothetical protein SKAU_G00004450 [Synaphobranchus kaupii]|uniref:Uncharacterized protein n=1 Tax=Synaphobranchus kaupii TaxID=118154 RepID=A0A9Q1GAH9_SYNKA|nr:hypothetical protein SKAU_G00004450 [Synaphobranchus kaupii]